MNTASLTKPGTCRRCKGDRFRDWQPNGGVCYGCGGAGVVETDRATLAAKKAHQAAASALGAAAMAHSAAAAFGLTHLGCVEPERYELAVASFAAGRTDVLDALAAYGREA